MVQFALLENEPLMLAAFGALISADQRSIFNGDSQLKLNHF